MFFRFYSQLSHFVKFFSCFLVSIAYFGKNNVFLSSVRPVTLMQPLTDLTVCEGDIAQLEVKFSQENVEGSWMKSGQAITASDRVHIIIDKLVHKLLLENVSREDAASYSFVVPTHEISTSGKLNIQSKY